MQAQQIGEVDDRAVLSKARLLDKASTGLGIFLPK